MPQLDFGYASKLENSDYAALIFKELRFIELNTSRVIYFLNQEKFG
jgi:hypothetical protein